MSSSLVGSSSSGSGGVERGRATNRLQRWQCGGIMHDMLKKGSCMVHSIEQSLASSTLRCVHAVFPASLSSLAYLASLGLFRCFVFVGALAICS